MIILGLIVSCFGVLVLIFAVRGRVIQRGQFCQGCKFDLSGLDLMSSDAKCPECGRDVHCQEDRRDYLRKSSRVGIAVSSLLLLAGIASISAQSKTSTIIASLPDPIILWLTDRGVDEALDELMVRSTAVPTGMSDDSWEHAIDSALEIQADTKIPWDKTWGEVIFQGLIKNRLDDQQLERYFANMDVSEIIVRDRVHPGVDGFGYMLQWSTKRNSMLTGGKIDYQLFHRVSAYGIEGEDPIWTNEPGRKATNGYWLMPNPGGSWMRTTTWNMAEHFDQAPGHTVGVYFEYEMTLVPLGEQTPVFAHKAREEFEIQIISPDEPIVQRSKDEAGIALLMDNMQIAPIRVMKQIEAPRPNNYTQVLRTLLSSKVPLDQLALEVYLRIDGQDIRVGSVTHNSSPDSFKGNAQWGINPDDEPGREFAQQIHAKLIENGVVTVIVRTNAELVEDIPGVDQVLGVEFMFDAVPVVIVETSDELNTPSDWDSAQGKAVPIAD